MTKEKGYMDDLSGYIKNNLKKGYTKESLKWALVEQGHSKLEVSKAILKAERELSQEAPILKTKPEISVEVIKESIPNNNKPWWKRIFGL